MVSQNEDTEAVQAPLPEVSEGNEGSNEFQPDINPLISEVDRLNGVADIDISEPVAEAPVTEQAIPEQPSPEKPLPEEAQTPEEPVAPDPTQQLTDQQIADLQRQAAEYEQVRQRAAVQQEEQRIRQHFETQGASPEEAQQQARQYIQGQTSQQDLIRQADEYGKHLVAKQNAAEHFARTYKLNIDDLSILKQADSPEIMEGLAKQIVERRKVQDELDQLRKAQVPSQRFDNSQGAPEVASSDGNWLDRYNAGDRAPNAVAAAKRTLGIE